MKLLEKENARHSKNQILKGATVIEKKKTFLAKFLNFSFYSIMIGFITGLFLMYGPYNGFRDWYITTAMTTMNHQYLATWFYSSETISEVLDRNKMIEVDSITDPALVTTTASTSKITYVNEYEKAVLEKDPNHPDYKIIKMTTSKYTGYLAVIYDPSSIQTLVTNNLKKEGQYLTDMANDAGATIAINGGVFTGLTTSSEELNSQELAYGGAGGSPQGLTISNGKVITNTSYNGVGGLIGFNEDDKLVLGKMTLKQAQNLKIRDAVTCGPFLIINGESSKVVGNGGWGTAPRTAIGQRKDGIVLMLAIDGRRATMPGATMEDLLEIMQNYGAYNASALDGGTSTAMVENGKLVNDPINSTGAHVTRPIATGFGAVFNK
ncbi:MAG: phosphodiester glycosidase family protein [Clostridia bacterium]|nr:phosphodiester glycosidase family protein [Clostridia bacterium]